MRQSSPDRINTAWEQDLNISLLDNVWDLIFNLVNSTSLCARHCLLSFTVEDRAHVCKAKLSCIYPDMNPRFDKCSNDGDGASEPEEFDSYNEQENPNNRDPFEDW